MQKNWIHECLKGFLEGVGVGWRAFFKDYALIVLLSCIVIAFVEYLGRNPSELAVLVTGILMVMVVFVIDMMK